MLEASQRGFIGLSIFPIFETPEQSADYPVIPLEAILKLKDTGRAPRGKYNRGDWEFEMGTYSCKEFGWEEPVDDAEAALYRRFFDAEEIATIRATDILLRRQEARIATAAFDVASITNTAAVAIEWSTAATAVPRANVYAARSAMRAATGLEPNVIAMSKKVFDNLMLTAEVTAAFRYTNPIEIGGYEAQARIMAQYFGLDRVLIGGAVYDSAKEGVAASIADMWDDEYVGLYRVSSGSRDLREPCIGRTFLWTGDSPQNLVTEQYREEQTRSNIYRVRHNVDEEYVFVGAGYLLSNITA
jgi:hypothetical protein